MFFEMLIPIRLNKDNPEDFIDWIQLIFAGVFNAVIFLLMLGLSAYAIHKGWELV